MKITKKQIMMLYQLAVATLSILSPLAFTKEERQKLVDEILNQQDESLIDID
jgi:hypothetical protein